MSKAEREKIDLWVEATIKDKADNPENLCRVLGSIARDLNRLADAAEGINEGKRTR